MNAHRTHISAPPGEIYWRYEVCPHGGAKVLLRTVGGIATIGSWYGALGDSFVAWCPLPTSGSPVEPIQRATLWKRISFSFLLIFNPEKTHGY